MRIPRPKPHQLLVVGLLTTLAAVSILVRGPVRGESDLSVPTTHSTEPGGLQGLFMVCEGLDLPVSRYTGSLETLDPARVPALAVVGDPEAGIDTAPLYEWVQGGGRLLLATRDPVLLRHFGVVRNPVWTAPKGKVVFAGQALQWGIPGELPPPDHAIPVPPATPGEVLARVEGPGVSSPLVLVLARGRGSVVLLADPDLLVNRSLENPARAVLAARLVEETAGGGRLAFCETIHGYADDAGPNLAMARILLRTPFGNAVLGGALFLLVMLISESKRFGRVRRTLEPPRRSEYEYLDALAGLLLAGRAWRQAGALLLLGARRRIGAEEGAGARGRARDLAEALAWDRPADADALREGAKALAVGKDPGSMVAGLAVLDRALPPERPRGKTRKPGEEGT